MANNKEAKVTLKLFNQEFNASMKATKDETTRLNKEFELQKQQMKLTASESEQLAAKVDYLKQKQELASKVTQETAAQYERIKKQFGENSTAANQMANKLLEAQIAEQKLANEVKTTANALQNSEQDIKNVGAAADKAGKDVKGFGEGFQQALGGLAAGGGIAGTVQQALDTSSLNTKIDITFDVPEESKTAIKETVKAVEAYGVQGEEALEGIRRQWALNADASDESNQKIVQGAAVIAGAYNQIDFTELVQETNEIAAALEITNEDALALTNALLKAGFPPEQLDTIAEYGTQMKMAGFSVAEIQSIFEQGISTKSWNIDNLNDGVKEAKIKMMEFGHEVDKSMSGLLSKAGMSDSQFKKWGQAVAAGGKEGSTAMSEMVTWLESIEDSTLQNEIATQVFGSKWEDQGSNLISVFQGINDAQDKTVENQTALNDAIDQTNSDPMVALKTAAGEVLLSLQPLLLMVAGVITKVAEWVSNNTTLAAILATVSTVIGTVAGLIAFLTPAIGTIVGWFGGWGAIMGVVKVALAALTGPIGLVIAGVTALIAIVIAIIKNWETLGPFFKNLWDGIKSFLAAVWEGIKVVAMAVFDAIKAYFTTVFNIYKTIITTVWNAIKTVITTIWNGIKAAAILVFDAIKTYFTTVFNVYKTIITTVWNAIKTVVTTVVNTIKTVVTNIFNGLKNIVSTAMNGVKTAITNGWNKAKAFLDGISLLQVGKDIIQGLINGISSMKDFVLGVIEDTVGNVIEFAKELLGINSPANTFVQFGAFNNNKTMNKAVVTKTVSKKSFVQLGISKLKELFSLNRVLGGV